MIKIIIEGVLGAKKILHFLFKLTAPLPHHMLNKLMWIFLCIAGILIYSIIYPSKSPFSSQHKERCVIAQYAMEKILQDYAKRCGKNHIIQIMHCSYGGDMSLLAHFEDDHAHFKDKDKYSCCVPIVVYRYDSNNESYRNYAHTHSWDGKYNKVYCNTQLKSELQKKIMHTMPCIIKHGGSLYSNYGDISEAAKLDNISEIRSCYITKNLQGHPVLLFVHSIIKSSDNHTYCSLMEDMEIIYLLQSVT